MSENFDDDRDAPDDFDAEPQKNQLVRRSFEGVSTLMNNAATQALTAKATADINARWMIAMHRPRHLMDVRDALLRECATPGFAAKAMYSVPRGGASVTGLSIRFAEAAMVAMGNMGVEAMTLYDSDTERTVRVTVTDFEVNAAWSRDLTVRKTKEVKRRPASFISERTNSYGDPVWTVEATDDDVTTKEASAISKASRTGILRLVPAWLLADCQAKIQAVMRDKAAADPRAEMRKVCDEFGKLNARPSWIEEWLGHPIDQATPAEIVELRQLYVGIRDGHTSLNAALSARKGGDDNRPAGVAASAVSRKPRQKQPEQTAGDKPITPEEAAEIERLERERR